MIFHHEYLVSLYRKETHIASGLFKFTKWKTSTIVSKGHCHGYFALFLSKLLNFFTKNLFSNMKLLLQHWEGNMKWFLQGTINYSQFLEIFPKYSEGTWKNWPIFSSCNPFPSSHPQPKINETSFIALVGLRSTKLNHYLNVYKYVFWLFKVTLKIGDNAPLTINKSNRKREFCLSITYLHINNQDEGRLLLIFLILQLLQDKTHQII